MRSGPLLDFGCGCKPYRGMLYGHPYIGLDFAGPGHDHSQESIDVFYDGKRIPYDTDAFGSIFTTEVFEHVINLPEVLGEIGRVIRPGGYLMITCPFVIGEHEAPADYARYTSFAMRQMLEQNGFEIVLQEKLGNSLEAISSLIQHYLHAHISPHVRKIPIIGGGIVFTYTCLLNRAASFLSRFLPAGKELYLTNFIIAKKKIS